MISLHTIPYCSPESWRWLRDWEGVLVTCGCVTDHPKTQELATTPVYYLTVSGVRNLGVAQLDPLLWGVVEAAIKEWARAEV